MYKEHTVSGIRQPLEAMYNILWVLINIGERPKFGGVLVDSHPTEQFLYQDGFNIDCLFSLLLISLLSICPSASHS